MDKNNKELLTQRYELMAEIVRLETALRIIEAALAKEKVEKTVWVNVYREENMIVARGTFGTKEEAERCHSVSDIYLGAHEITVEVEELCTE